MNWALASSAKRQPFATSSSKVPFSITCPLSNTRMRVALRMVESRWAITKVVRPFITSSRAALTLASVTASSALVASSRIRIGGSFSSARAIESRCRSPPESMRPRSPAWVSNFFSLRSMNSSACARPAAVRISSSVASGLPMRRLSAIERLNSSASWNTTPIFRRSAVSLRPRISMPSILMMPDCGSNARCNSAIAVDLPGPVAHRRHRIQHVEEVLQSRGFHEHAVDEADHLFELLDQHGREAHEHHDLTDGRLSLFVQDDADGEDRKHGDGGGGAGDDGHQRPPRQYRHLHREQLVGDKTKALH